MFNSSFDHPLRYAPTIGTIESLDPDSSGSDLYPHFLAQTLQYQQRVKGISTSGATLQCSEKNFPDLSYRQHCRALAGFKNQNAFKRLVRFRLTQQNKQTRGE